MKSKLFCVLILVYLLTISNSIFAQTAFDSVRISGYLHVEHSDHIQWIKRFQQDIDKYAEENKRLGDLSCDVLFLGSSSINLWHNIYNDMSPMKIIRRSYGGATIRDMIYNYNTIARNYKPKAIVMYAENDFCSCKEGISVGETYDLFRVFIQTIKRDYPGTPLFVISFKPSFVKADQLKQQLTINSLLEDYSKRTASVFYIDITKVMYDDNGNLRKDIFGPDNLHINQKGYDLWTEKIKPRLLEIVNKKIMF